MEQAQGRDLSQPTPFDNPTIRRLRRALGFRVPPRLVLSDRDQSLMQRVRGEVATVSGPNTVDRLLELARTLQREYPRLAPEDVLFVILTEVRNLDPREQLRLANAFMPPEQGAGTGPLSQRFTAHAQLLDEIDAWSGRLRAEFQTQTVNALRKIDASIQELRQTQPVRASELDLRSVSISRQVIVDQNRPPEFGDYLEAFAMCQLSERIPYVELINGGQRYYKVFNGEDPAASNRISPEHYLPEDERTSEMVDRFAFMVWLGNGPDERRDHNTYVMGRIFLDDNRLHITFPPSSQQQLDVYFGWIEAFVPCLSFGPQRYSEVAGSFNILDVVDGPAAFRNSTFLYRVLNDETLQTYLYSAERARTTAEKKRLIVHFRTEPLNLGPSEADITIGLTGRVANEPLEMVLVEERQDLTLQTTQTVVPAGTPYITVAITRAENMEVARQFIRVFTRLVRLYLSKEQETLELYQDYFPGVAFPPLWEMQRDADMDGGAGGEGENVPARQRRRIFRLRSAAEDIFVTEYARLCQAAYQPEPIPASEVARYRAQTITVNGERINRQVMEFPRPQDQRQRGQPPVFLICPNPEYPYPGMKLNRRTPNRDLYPYMPCCTKTDQMSPGLRSYYHDYMEGRMPAVKTQVEYNLDDPGTRIETDKIAEPGRIGTVPFQIRDLLDAIGVQTQDLVRYGVVRDQLSVIHCMLTIFDENYRNTLEIADRQAQAQQFMEQMAGQIPLATLRQEMFDMTDLQIAERIRNTQIFADPRVLHRFLEEAFDINLFVFVREKEEISPLLPRHRIAYLHNTRINRPSVILYQHMGAESDFLDFPQVEIIMDFPNWTRKLPKTRGKPRRTLNPDGARLKDASADDDDDALPSMVFPFDPVGQQMERLLQYSQHVRIWNVGEADANPLPHSAIPPPPNAASQFIDANGKLRSLVYDVGGQQVWVLTPLLPPQRLNSVPLGTVFRRSTEREARSVFGRTQPSGFDIRDDRQVVGLWFGALYIPIQPIPATAQHQPRGPVMDLIPDLRLGPVRDAILNRRAVDLLLQVVWWLFTLYLQSGGSADERGQTIFFRTWTRVGSNTCEVREGLRSLPVVLPVVQNPADAIAALRPLCGALFAADRPQLLLPSARLMEVVGLRLKEHLRNIGRYPIQVPTTIYNRYMYSHEIPTRQGEVAFVGFEAFARWVETHDASGVKLVHSRLDQDALQEDMRYQAESQFATLPQEPFIYRDAGTQSSYLLQPQGQGEAAEIWRREMRNPGFQYGPVQEPLQVVQPDASGRINLPQQRNGQNPTFVETAGQTFTVLPFRNA